MAQCASLTRRLLHPTRSIHLAEADRQRQSRLPAGLRHAQEDTTMVEVVQDGQFRAYADFDNRSLAREPQRTALANLPVIDLSPYLREGTRDERMQTARTLRSACIDIGFFYLIGHGFT